MKYIYLAETTRLKHYFNIQSLADVKLINENYSAS